METRTDEIADGISRLSILVPEAAPGGFTFNQFLIEAEASLLFHTGPRRMFPLVSAAIARILPLSSLRLTFVARAGSPLARRPGEGHGAER